MMITIATVFDFSREPQNSEGCSFLLPDSHCQGNQVNRAFYEFTAMTRYCWLRLLSYHNYLSLDFLQSLSLQSIQSSSITTRGIQYGWYT